MTKKSIAYTDIYEYSQVSGAKWSPDGRYAVFTENRADEEKNGYKTCLWLYEKATGRTKRLTSSGSDRFAYWEEETGAVVFASGRPGAPKREGAKPEDPVTHLFRIFPDGGEAEFYFDLPTAGSLTPIKDGLFLVRSFEHALPEDERPKRKGYQVFDEIPFWINGMGVTNKKRPALSIFDRASGKLTRFTSPLFEAGGADVSPDKTKIAFTGSELVGAKRRQGGLFVCDIASGKTETLIDPLASCVDKAAFWDDDTLLIGINPCKDSHSASDLYRYDLTTREMTKFPHDLAIYQTVRDSDLLYFCHDEWSHSRIGAMNSAGEIVYSLSTPGSVTGFDVKDGEIVLTGDRPDGMQEFGRVEGGAVEWISAINDGYVETHEIIPAERFTFMNSDGVEIEGFVIKPAGWEKGGSYPGLLEIHGGPKAAYNVAYNHEMQAYAAQGYYVFFCNPRGSSGRTSEFADITGKLGTIDYRDVMEFTDEVLAREPELDEKRLGVLGGSYGGFMTNWIIGHTNRFAAAASQRSISNYFTKCLTTDIGHYHNLTQMETDPWQGPEVFWEHSPLKYADRCVTPTIFICSDHDFRCWFAEGIQMYNAIRQNGVDARLCIFKDENHELSRSGKPKNRISRLDEMLKWFDRYLKK